MAKHLSSFLRSLQHWWKKKTPLWNLDIYDVVKSFQRFYDLGVDLKKKNNFYWPWNRFKLQLLTITADISQV